MKWYEKHNQELNAAIVGTFEESEVAISAIIKVSDDPVEFLVKKLYSKSVTMWAHQEILAEDILNKYMGKIKKAEDNLPMLVEKERLRKRI